MSDKFKIFIDSWELLIQSSSWGIYPHLFENKKQWYGLTLWRSLRIYFNQSYCCYVVTKFCLDLFWSHDWSPPGFSVYGISQTVIVEWVSLSFSRRSFWPRDQTHIDCSVDSLQLSHQGSRFFKVVVMKRRNISKKKKKLLIIILVSWWWLNPFYLHSPLLLFA